MVRHSLRPLAVGVFAAALTTACATMPLAGPIHFYTSWSGEDRPTHLLFVAVDEGLRAEPAFVRDFSESMNVHFVDGVSQPGGQSRYLVRITIPSRLANRRIKERDRTLAEFSVTCDPDRPQPCVDQILSRARLQPARIRRIVARSPKAARPR